MPPLGQRVIVTGALNGDFGHWIGWTGDVNGHGMLDFVISNGTARPSVRVSFGNGSFTPTAFVDLAGASHEGFGTQAF